jgi:hypothetical protein
LYYLVEQLVWVGVLIENAYHRRCWLYWYALRIAFA